MEKRGDINPETTPDVENKIESPVAGSKNAADNMAAIENLDADFRKRAAETVIDKIK